MKILLPLVLGVLVAGCSVAEKSVINGYLALNRMKARDLVMSDGYRGRYYEHIYGDPRAVDTVLFFVQGSGSGTTQLACRFLLNGLPGNVRVFALEKRYVSSWSTGGGRPSSVYLEHYHPSAFLSDQKEFIAHILEQPDAGGKSIVVLGVSAGGLIAAELARAFPQVTHLATLGEGGMKGLDSFRLWGQRHKTDFDAVWQDVSADPSRSRVVGGYSARFWYEMLAADPMEPLGALDIPIFAAMGERDESVPIESLTYLSRTFAERGKTNLTTKVYVGCDHALDECGGQPGRAAFCHDLMAWVHSSASRPRSRLPVERDAP
jgi:pimeloyl-ACP methyl ester carboxylesterase